MASKIHIELNGYVSDKIYNGRPGNPKKNIAKIPGVMGFNRKMVFIRSTSLKGCPFAIKAIECIDRRISSSIKNMITQIKVIDGYRYDSTREKRTIEIEYDSVIVDVSIRSAMTLAFHYIDHGFRTELSVDEIGSKGYKDMVRVYGEPKVNISLNKLVI